MSARIIRRIHPLAYKILLEADREIGEYYMKSLDTYETAEAFNVDPERVAAIVKELKKHYVRVLRAKSVFRDYLD